MNAISKPTTITPTTFTIRNLSVLAYANGFTLWHYNAGKARLEEVAADNFFRAASDMLAAGDIVMVSAADGARMLTVTLAGIDAVVTAPMA
jgi:hypothetical protein